MNIDQLKQNWEAFGRKDPLWAIRTLPDKKHGKWKPDEFFNSGREEVGGVLDYLKSLGIAVERESALDFGCGVGRLTQALADHFDDVEGVDIAISMIKLARKYNRVGDRCRYYTNETDNLRLFADGRFDFIYSNMVLQHMEPRYAKNYLREFVRLLTPKGVLIFQIPAALIKIPPPPFRKLDEPVMEMHCMPREEVTGIIEESGARVIDVSETDDSGPYYLSLRYCVKNLDDCEKAGAQFEFWDEPLNDGKRE
jgi:SAM-dependent methyltransferase